MALCTQGSLSLSITTVLPKAESEHPRSAGTFAIVHHRHVFSGVVATLLQGHRFKLARTLLKAEASCKAAVAFRDGGAAGWCFNRQPLVSHCVHRGEALQIPDLLICLQCGFVLCSVVEA
jgi:hypothetical protein